MNATVNPTVFLSYARGDDEDFVRRLHDDLEAAGFDAWFDRLDMPQRPLTFHQEIEDAIRERDRLIYIAGPRAASSDYVRQEWRSALGFDKHVIPLLRLGEYEEVLPAQLTLMHCEDFRDDALYGTQLGKLIANLQQPEPRLGALKAVPNLPRTLLARPLLMRRVKDALLVDLQKPLMVAGAAATADDQGDAPQQIGVQGMGGIGKSVLAAAVARDREVRRAYPDGIIWLTLGPETNLAALMQEFAALLGCDGTFTTVVEGKAALKEFCAQKAVLLVLDDIWSARDAEAFDVLGPRCRMLVTTRDSGILRTLHGDLFPVELLSAVQARKLLADSARADEGTLPPEADEIVRQCGCLPLGIALAGGMVAQRDARDGRADNQQAWRNVLTRLQRADLDKVRDRQAINPQHESIWKAMAASVDVLGNAERNRFTELSAFLPDQRIPMKAVASLWEHTGGLDDLDTDDLLSEFAERSLLRLETDTDGIRLVWLHDLLYDFAKRIAGPPEALNRQLLAAYRARCADGWASGPNDGYYLESLCRHLASDGQSMDIQALLTDFPFLEAKCRAGLVHSLLDDYELAGQILGRDENRDRVVEFARFIRRRMHVLLQRPDMIVVDALNSCSTGTVSARAEQILANSTTSTGHWLLRTNRPSMQALTAVQTFTVHGSVVQGVAITQEADRLITASGDGTVEVWDLGTGARLMTFQEHTDQVTALALIDNSRRLISADLAGAVKIWNIDTGRCLRTLQGDGKHARCIAVSSTGHRAALGCTDHSIKVFDPSEREHARSFSAGGRVYHIAIDKDGSKIVATVDTDADYSKTARAMQIWDLAGSRPPVFVHLKAPDYERPNTWGLGYFHDDMPLTLTPDGRYMLAACLDNRLRMWHLETGDYMRTFVGHERPVSGLAVTPDGDRAISAGWDGSVKVWRMEDGELIWNSGHFAGGFEAMALSSQGDTVVVGERWGRKARVLTLPVDDGKHARRELRHEEHVTDVAFASERRQVISASWDKTIKVWAFESGEQLRTIRGHRWEVLSLAVLDDGPMIAAGDGDGSIKIWDICSGACLHRLNAQVPTVEKLLLSPNHELMLQAGSDAAMYRTSTVAFFPPEEYPLYIWSTRSWAIVHSLSCHTDYFEAMAFSADGKIAVTGGKDGKVCVWAPHEGRLLNALEGHDRNVCYVAITPDNRNVVSVADVAKVWELSSGDCVRTLSGISGPVVLTLDGRSVLSTCDCAPLRIWDLTTGEHRDFEGQPISASRITLGADGAIAITGSADGAVQVWDIKTRREKACFFADDEVTALAVDGVAIAAADRSGRVYCLRLEGG